MPTTGTVIIGAGQAGLATSRCLSDRGVDHVVLERGRIGQRWRSETWDELHLLSPNWMNTLPGRPYAGPDPDGFSSAAAFAYDLVNYALSFGAPVEEGTRVLAVERRGDSFRVVTDDAVWTAANVVTATGWCDRPAIPPLSRALPDDIYQIAPNEYRNPDQLPPGGVLVVGASATGVQLAEGLRAAGRDVTIAVGSHTRLPRTYRGMDIYWWLDRLGLLDKTIDEMRNPQLARREPSLQLVGRHRSLDLASLQADGVHLVGRVRSVKGHRVLLAADLPATVAHAQRRMDQLLARIESYIEANGLASEVLAAQPRPAVAATPVVPELDLHASGITNVVWATGYRRSYPWLRLRVLDRAGEIRQRRGVTPVQGLYVVGQRFQYRRNSNFIGGVGRDAAFIAERITARHTATGRHPSACARTDS